MTETGGVIGGAHDRRFGTRFLLAAGRSGCCSCSPSRSAFVLAISFGTIDDLGRAVYGVRPRTTTRTSSTRSSLPVLLRSVGLRGWPPWSLCLLIGYPIAYYIARFGGRCKHALIAALVMPFFVNYLVRTYAWVAMLSDEGLVNNACSTSA